MIAIILKATVLMKTAEAAIAMFLSFFLLISTLILPRLNESSSEVMSNIIEIMAMSMLISQKSRGKIMCSYPSFKILYSIDKF